MVRWFYVALIAAMAAVILTFAVQDHQSVTVSFLGLLVAVIYLLGMVCTWWLHWSGVGDFAWSFPHRRARTVDIYDDCTSQPPTAIELHRMRTSASPLAPERPPLDLDEGLFR